MPRLRAPVTVLRFLLCPPLPPPPLPLPWLQHARTLVAPSLWKILRESSVSTLALRL
jgi:hypothetical protein